MPERDKVAEDAHQCYYCTDFAFLSMIQCKHHKINYCLMHQVMCGCSKENLTLVYRYSTKELDRLERMIADSCKNMNHSSQIEEKENAEEKSMSQATGRRSKKIEQEESKST